MAPDGPPPEVDAAGLATVRYDHRHRASTTGHQPSTGGITVFDKPVLSESADDPVVMRASASASWVFVVLVPQEQETCSIVPRITP